MRTPSLRTALTWACLLAAAGCGRGSGSEEVGARPVVSVRARPVERWAFADRVEAPGQWRASGEVVVAAPFDAVVESLGVRVGDRVEAGQVVGLLATRESEAMLRGARLLLEQARDAAARAEAERALEVARHDLVLVPIAAPRRGVVVRRSLEAGAQVGASAEILALVTPDAVVFEAHVPAAQAERLRVGQPATITVEGRSPCPAVLQRVLPVAGGSDQSTLVWLATTEPVVGFELERFGNASIQLGPERSALAVPDSAVVEDDLTAATRVAVVRDRKQAVWTTVHLGAAAGGWRELKPPGLPPGTLVVTEGQRGLPDSAAVAVEP